MGTRRRNISRLGNSPALLVNPERVTYIHASLYLFFRYYKYMHSNDKLFYKKIVWNLKSHNIVLDSNVK